MIVEMSLVGLRSGHEFAIEKPPLINAAQKFVKTEKFLTFTSANSTFFVIFAPIKENSTNKHFQI